MLAALLQKHSPCLIKKWASMVLAERSVYSLVNLQHFVRVIVCAYVCLCVFVCVYLVEYLQSSVWATLAQPPFNLFLDSNEYD